MSINKVFITGNLTRDAELRATQAGTSILALGVAVDDRRKDQRTGEWEDVPNFVDCTLFGRRAEALASYLTKGTKVAIEGRLHYSSWQDRQTGQNRSRLDVTVDEIEFMSARNAPQPVSQPTPQPMSPQPAYAAQTAAQPAYAQQQMGGMPQPAYSDDDIPFD